MRIQITSLLCLLGIQFLIGQGFTISGEVRDGDNNPLPFVNILVMKTSDSTLVKGGITDDLGAYNIRGIAAGNYRVEASMVGFQPARSDAFELTSDIELPGLILISGETLNEVVIEAQKPLFQQKVDRMVINVESSIVSTGGSALEILERSPGVLVNRQSNSISLIGKDGVVVMINGKISYVPAASIIQMLEGMNASNIESIELITTPPANFDAEGNAGYINIVLKQRTDLGLNGSYSITGGYGNGLTNSDNFNFNYRKNKVNIFGSYSFYLDQRDQLFQTSREFAQDGDLLSTATSSFREPSQVNNNVRLGLDMELSDKTIMGVILNGFNNRWSMNALNLSEDQSNQVPTGFVNLDNEEVNQLKHFGANYNIKHEFSDDESLSLDLNYLYYGFDNPTDYENSFFDSSMELMSEEELRSRKETPITTLVGQLDYSSALSKSFKIETGIKWTNSSFENDVSIENLVDGSWVFDESLTNRSELDETYYAIYTSSDITIDEKTSAKAGLRYEHTISILDSDTQGRLVDRDFGVWFPSIFLNRQFHDDFSMNLSYSKRITRPTFNDLAPFVIFLDPTTFLAGNAALQPAISNSFKFDINFKSYFLSFQYTNEDNTIANFQEQIDEETGRLFFEAENLDYTRTFSAIFGFPLKLAEWWRTQNNLSYIRLANRAFYNEVPIEQETGLFTANSTHSFKYDNSLSAEISGFYRGPSFFGSANYDSFFGINAGIQYKFEGNWGSLKFALNDIFESIEFTGGTNIPDQNIRTQNLWDFSNRTYLLTWSRNFGNSNLKSSRNRGTAADAERERVN